LWGGKNTDGKTECYIYFCSGERKLKRGEIEGPIEKNSKKFLKKIVLNLPAQVFICVIFIIYLGFSIFGVLQFKEDLDFRDLVQCMYNSACFLIHESHWPSYRPSKTLCNLDNKTE
jgi:hypothetical protein